MLQGVRRRLRAVAGRLRRLERRELRAVRRWIEHTPNLVRLSVIVFVPLCIGLVTYLSNAVTAVSFLLFPPLASGTYTLFAEPHGRYADPLVFVGGMTAGALSGWAALVGSQLLVGAGTGPTPAVTATGAAAAILLTGLVTWALSLEAPSAFSTALLALVTGGDEVLYVVGIVLSSTLVAGVFYVWREEIYEQRARYLYGTTQADDHVVVPLRGGNRDAVTALGARIAAAHDAGKVVLLDVVPDETVAAAEAELLETGVAGDRAEARAVAEARTAAEAVRTLEARADRVRATHDVPCEVVVAAGDPDDAGVVLEAAAREDCDLVVTAFEPTPEGPPAGYVRDLFASRLDVVALRSRTGATAWEHPLVTVGRGGEIAHAMIDYAQRVAGAVTVGTCIAAESDRRAAESMLADLAETVAGSCETRVSRSGVAEFLARADDEHDLVFVGASTDRSAASRFLSPPTYERLEDVESDVAVVHVG